MTIEDLIEMLTKRVAWLQMQSNAAANLGDLNQVINLNAEVAQTQTTLQALRSLQG